MCTVTGLYQIKSSTNNGLNCGNRSGPILRKLALPAVPAMEVIHGLPVRLVQHFDLQKQFVIAWMEAPAKLSVVGFVFMVMPCFGCDPFNPMFLCGICEWDTTNLPVSWG